MILKYLLTYSILSLTMALSLWGQNTFNKKINLITGTTEWGYDVMTLEDGFIIAGSMGVPDSIAFFVVKTNFLGDTLWTYKLQDPPFDYFASFHGNNIIEESDGYVICGTFEAENIPIIGYNGFLLKLNKEGEQEWFTSYDSDSGYPPYFYSVRKTPDNGFIILGKEELQAGSNNLRDPFLMKMDSNRNVIWKKFHHASNTRSDALHHFYPDYDGGYVFDGMVLPPNTIGDRYSRFLKTDSLGTAIWDTILYEGNADYCNYGLIIPTQDKGYLYRDCIDTTLIDTLPPYHLQHIVKIDSNRNVVWDLLMGVYHTQYDVWEIIELPDGDFVGWGLNLIPPGDYGYNLSTAGAMRWIFKISKEGEFLWERNYIVHNDHYSAAIRDMDYVANDGGFIFSGSIDGSVEPEGGNLWLFKVDSLGCLNPDDCERFNYINQDSVYSVHPELTFDDPYYFSLEDALQTIPITIYPNPSKGIIHIDTPLFIEKIEVFNLMGNPVFKKEKVSNPTIDLTHLSKGIYFLKCYVDGGQTVTRKVILH